MISARMSITRKLLDKKLVILVVPTIVIVLITIFFTVQVSKNTSTMYVVNFTSEAQGLEFCKQFQNNQELITPYNFEVPISNFYEIEEDTIDHIRKRLIDNDIRNTVLLKKLTNFFYLSTNKNLFSIKLLAKTKAVDKLVTSKLQKEHISYSKSVASTDGTNTWIVILLFIVVIILIINIPSSYIKKLILILFWPWFVFMIISASVIFSFSVLVLLLLAMNIFALYYDKISITHKLPLSVLVVLFIGILLSLSLIGIYWELIVYYAICMLCTYVLFVHINRIQRKKEHRIPFFVKIIPEQPLWLLHNKVIVLTTGIGIIILSTLFTNTHANIALSQDDFDMHMQKQFLSIYGSIYNTATKPSITISNDTVHLIFLDPKQNSSMSKSTVSFNFEKQIAKLNTSYHLLNKYSVTLLGIICIGILIDLFSSAGKKLKKLLYFKSSVKTLPDGMNITITDASI